MKSKFIYGLLRPKNGECFYVGLIKEKEKRRMAKKKRGDVEIKGRLRAGTLHFVASANERRRVLDIARIDELNITTREQSGGGFAVIYMPNTRKL